MSLGQNHESSLVVVVPSTEAQPHQQLWELCFGHSLSYSRLNIILSYQLPLAFCGCTCEVNLFIPGCRTRRGDVKHGVRERGQDNNCKEKARVSDKMKWEACPTIKDSLNISRMWFAYYSTECTRDFSSFMISKPWDGGDWTPSIIFSSCGLNLAHIYFIFLVLFVRGKLISACSSYMVTSIYSQSHCICLLTITVTGHAILYTRIPSVILPQCR